MSAFSLLGFEGALDPPPNVESGLLFLFHGDRLLMDEGGTLPQGRPADFGGVRAQYLGKLGGKHAFAAQHPGQVPGGFQFPRLRTLFGALPEPLFALAALAYQLVEWDRTFRFCGVCATETVRHPHERAKRCPNCGYTNYPRLSPAVMVLVTRGDELLLSRGPHFQKGMYSANAGFVEPGESLEECARREVREEVGVEIGELRYFGSQPWPFPHSLMIAFTAEYAGGEVVPREGEIEDARWFSVDELPLLPGPISVARALIDATVKAVRRQRGEPTP